MLVSPLLSLARPISLVVLFTGAPGLICINYRERETSEDGAETTRRKDEGEMANHAYFTSYWLKPADDNPRLLYFVN